MVSRGGNSMAMYKLGLHVRIQTSTNESFEGTIYTVDAASDMLVLQSPQPAAKGSSASASSGQCTMRMINRAQIKHMDILGSSEVDPAEAMQNLYVPTSEELAKKEAKLWADLSRAMAQINKDASVEGQKTFNMLSKTMDCDWYEQSIIVLEQVRIDPPYGVADCKKLQGCPPAAFDRIKTILGQLRRKSSGGGGAN